MRNLTDSEILDAAEKLMRCNIKDESNIAANIKAVVILETFNIPATFENLQNLFVEVSNFNAEKAWIAL